MTTEEQLFKAVADFRDLTAARFGMAAENWLNVAYKLDYISLSQKESADAILKKCDEICRFGISHTTKKSEITAISTIAEIAGNTHFSPLQLKYVQ